MISKGAEMIGDIIKKQRLLLDMSRKTLSEGICSEKYVYLIERNERNPSAYILNGFSDRLGIDLFGYYQYLNYDNKTKVFKHVENFERYSKTSDILKLKNESLEASELKAFQQEPLIYDIKVIDCLYKTIVLDEAEEAAKELNKIIETDELNIDPITLVNAYVALATAYQLEGLWEQAREAIEIAYDLIRDKTAFTRYNTVIISVLISVTSLLYNLEEYEELVKYSNWLMDFQEKYSEYNRFYYVEYYLAFAYYKTGDSVKARDHFMRGGYSALLFKNKIDIEFIMGMSGFKEITENLEIDPQFIEQLNQVLESRDN